MRVHVTNWLINHCTQGANSFGASPPGRVVGSHIEKDSTGRSWLRLVTIENEEGD